MAETRTRQFPPKPHELNRRPLLPRDESRCHEASDDASETSDGPLEESHCCETGDNDSEGELEPSVLEDMQRIEESFRGINSRYRLINRIGEGQYLQTSTG